MEVTETWENFVNLGKFCTVRGMEYCSTCLLPARSMSMNWHSRNEVEQVEFI